MNYRTLEDLAKQLGVDKVSAVQSVKGSTLFMTIRGYTSSVFVPVQVIEDDQSGRGKLALWDEIQEVCRLLRDHVEIREWLIPRSSKWSPYDAP